MLFEIITVLVNILYEIVHELQKFYRFVKNEIIESHFLYVNYESNNNWVS